MAREIKKRRETAAKTDGGRGAEQLYQAYLSSGLTLEEFEGPRYQRIGHIKKLMVEGVLAHDLRRTVSAERLASCSGGNAHQILKPPLRPEMPVLLGPQSVG
jgi:hypothetical protein